MRLFFRNRFINESLFTTGHIDAWDKTRRFKNDFQAPETAE